MAAQTAETLAHDIGQIPHDRTIAITGPLRIEEASLIIERLRMMEASPADILVTINCPGGHYHAGMELYNAFRASRCTIVGLTDGMARSAGFIALQGCEIRVAMRRTELRIHDPEYYCTHPIKHDTSKEKWLEICSKVYDANHSSIAKVRYEVVKAMFIRCGCLEKAEIEALLESGHVMSAQDALNRGFLDAVLD